MSSKLEEMIASALDEAEIEYEREMWVKERKEDNYPKYKLDFAIKAREKLINIECDGFTYHDTPEQKEKDKYRDAWLYKHFAGNICILRFNTDEIKYDINKCVNEIKKNIEVFTGRSFEYLPEKKNLQETKNNSPNMKISNTLEVVTIYTASYSGTVDGYGIVSYQINFSSNNEFIKDLHIFTGVNRKRCQSLSLLMALRKINSISELKIYTESKWLADVCNSKRLLECSMKLSDKNLFIQINNELIKHRYEFYYWNKNNESEPQYNQIELYNEVKDRYAKISLCDNIVYEYDNWLKNN